MTYTIGELNEEYMVSIFDKKALYRFYRYPIDTEDIEAVVQVLTEDAEIHKEREGEPK